MNISIVLKVLTVSVICWLLSVVIALSVKGVYHGDVPVLSEKYHATHQGHVSEETMHKFFSDYYRSDEYTRAAHVRALWFSWIPWFVLPFFMRPLRLGHLLLFLPMLIALWAIGFLWIVELGIYGTVAILGVLARERLWKNRPREQA